MLRGGLSTPKGRDSFWPCVYVCVKMPRQSVSQRGFKRDSIYSRNEKVAWPQRRRRRDLMGCCELTTRYESVSQRVCCKREIVTARRCIIMALSLSWMENLLRAGGPNKGPLSLTHSFARVEEWISCVPAPMPVTNDSIDAHHGDVWWKETCVYTIFTALLQIPSSSLDHFFLTFQITNWFYRDRRGVIHKFVIDAFRGIQIVFRY